jgi:hypothetical protein
VGGKGEKRAFSPSYFNSTPLNETNDLTTTRKPYYRLPKARLKIGRLHRPIASLCSVSFFAKYFLARRYLPAAPELRYNTII